MGLAADTGETITVDNALETLTLGGTDNINERSSILEDVFHCDDIAELEFNSEVILEFDEFAHRSCSCLFEMAHEGRAGVLFGCFVIGKLHCGVTIFLHGTNLRDNARTSLDNGAWYVLTIGTENGSHSDFLSN